MPEYVSEDGVMGPQTLRAARKVSPGALQLAFRAIRADHYIMLAELDSKKAKFLHGWLKRAQGEFNG